MGYNTVAVLLNDFTHEIEKDGQIGAQIANAMRNYSDRKKTALAGFFGTGSVISQAHADHEQVVIVSRNTGVRVDEAKDLGWQALRDMAECLERHGYKVTKPKKKAAPPAQNGE